MVKDTQAPVTVPTMRVVIASTKKAGHRNQCVGLLQFLHVCATSEILIQGSSASDSPSKKFAMRIWSNMLAIIVCLTRPMAGTLVIASGQAIIPLCWLMKALYRNRILIIYVGSPKTRLRCADILIRSEHQRTASERFAEYYHWPHQTIWIQGVISATGASQSQSGETVAVLIGGKNKTFDFTGAEFSRFVNNLGKLAANDPAPDVTVVLSRRTEAVTVEQLRRELGHLCKIVPTNDREGYLAAIEQAKAFVVTPDSVTMVSEACATGKPVFVAELKAIRKDTSNYQMITSFKKEGYIDYFNGTIQNVPSKRLPAEGQRIAAQVHLVIEAWRKANGLLSDP